MKYEIFKITFTLALLLFPTLLMSKLEVSIVENNKEPLDYNYVEYPDFVSSALMMQPDALFESYNEEQKLIANSIYQIRNSDFVAAKKFLLKALNSSDRTVKGLATDYLANYYLLHDLYDKHGDLYDKSLDIIEDYDLKSTKVEIFKNDTINIKKDNDLIIIKVDIQDESYNFLFDTGTDKSILKESVFELFDLEEIDYPISVGPDDREAFLTEIPTVKLGRNIIKYPDFLILDDEMLEFNDGLLNASFKIDGILGWDIINKFDYIFDIANDRIILNTELKTDSKNNLYWLGHPFIMLQKEGYAFNFLFDTGSQTSRITNQILNKLELEKIDEEKISQSVVGGEQEYVANVYKELKLNWFNYTINFSEIYTNNEDNIGFAFYDGVIGTDLLQKGKIYFSPKSGKIIFLSKYD